MPGHIDNQKFLAMLADRYPDIAGQLVDYETRAPFFAMQAVARETQTAIKDGDVRAVRDYFKFMDEIYRQATPDVQNAVHVSYLECISFDGRRALSIKAREMLSPALQAALGSLENYLRELRKLV